MFSLATWVTLFQRAVMQGVPILFGATGEILTEKSGNLNLGIPGIMYVGGISGVIGSFLYEQHVTELNPFLAVLIPLICTLFGSLLMGLLYCFLTVTLRANQNVTGLAITTFGVGFGNFFGASMVQLTGSDIPSIALTRTSTYFRAHLPIAEKMGAFGEMFLSYGFLAYVSIVIAIVCAVFLKRTRGGLHLRAVGENPATADAAGINVERSKYMATCIGSMIAGLGGLYYVMDYACGVWSNDGFGDRGWLAIALVIFAIWRPNLAIFGSILFGFLYIVYLFIPGLDLRPGVEVLLVPTLKDFIHIGPLQSPGVEAGLLIGHLKGLGIEIHIQPGLGIPVLRRGQAPPGDLQQLHQVGRPGIPGILGLHIGRRLFQGVDALLRPGVGLLLNGPQRGVPVGALPAQPLLAIAHQHAHHLGGQVQVIPEGQ